ncbi:MAG: inorganic diphosphatase [Chthoniobacterales bacterium]
MNPLHEKGNTVRNNRLIAVAVDSPAHEDFRSLDDLAGQRLHEIEHFLISYHEAKGKKLSRWVASIRSGREP